MTVGRPIVAGVDGSTSALNAALWAADVAVRGHHPLRLMVATNAFAFAYAAASAPPQSYFDQVQADGLRVLADVETEIHRHHPDLEIMTDLRSDGPVQALIESTGDARMLVLGARGKGGFRGILVGSTAVELVAHGRCPVAVIRGSGPDGTPPSHGPVVVGVDGSPTSEAAVAAAFDEASWRSAELVAVHSWLEHTPDADLPPRDDAEWAQVEREQEEVLAERLAGWSEKYPDVVVRRVLVRGRPVERLLEQAADAQLIVVGSRGHGGIGGMLLGSTSRALIYHATCPLLVVRA